MHTGRRAATALLLGMALGGMAPKAVAAGSRIYSDPMHGYTMRYPSDWFRAAGIPEGRVELDAPGGDTIVTSLAIRGSATDGTLRAAEAREIRRDGAPAGPFSHRVATIHGVRFQRSERVVRTRGLRIDLTLLEGRHGAYVYQFQALAILDRPTARAELAAASAILGSSTVAL